MLRKKSSLVQSVIYTGPVCVLALATQAWGQWPQWGGPDRNFKVEAKGLADTWPEDGPVKFWHRELGDGYAPITVDDGMLFTMYRKDSADENEYTVALDARTGAILWEHSDPSPITANMAHYGPGPHSAPLAVGDRLFTVGANLVFRCFEKKTGKPIWERDLLKEYNLSVSTYGFASSPLKYMNTVILPVVGEEEQDERLVAFDQKDGSVVWTLTITRETNPHSAYSSPIIISLRGEEQLIYTTNEAIFGCNPSNGTLLWKHPCMSLNGVNVSTPVFNGEDLLFFSAAYDSGARAVRLNHENGKTVPEELWYSRKMRIHHGNAMLLGDHVYGSSGDFGPAFFMGMNIHTGKRLWLDRGFSKATCVYADGKLILLDEDGQLALATVTPERLTVHSKCKITERLSWTHPTLVGTTLYVRDRKHIMALDLG